MEVDEESRRTGIRFARLLLVNEETFGDNTLLVRKVNTIMEGMEDPSNMSKTSLILYGPCIILQYTSNPTRYTIFNDHIYIPTRYTMYLH